jgi:predicted transposase YdaD
LNTPYDNAFKSIIKKCPRMALFLINEMFYKTNLIDEKYDGTERIELLDKEIPNLAVGPSEMDLRVAVYKSTRRTFHMECQSTSDGTMILRMVRYDTWTALDEAAYTQSFVRVKLDDSGVLFLRSTRNTPDVMTVLLEVPQGKSVSYQIPVIKIKEVTSIMGGTILEFSADKFFNAGKAEGRAEGRAEGKAEGVISTLVSLVKDGILTESAAAKRANMTEDDFRAALLSTTNP